MTWITLVSAPFAPHSVHDMDHTTCISTLYTPQRLWHGLHHVYQHPLHPTASMTWITRVSAPFTSHSVHDVDLTTCISTLYTRYKSVLFALSLGFLFYYIYIQGPWYNGLIIRFILATDKFAHIYIILYIYSSGVIFQITQFKITFPHFTAGASQQTQDIEPIMVWCWPNVYDAGPTSNQHRFNVSCWNVFVNLWCTARQIRRLNKPQGMRSALRCDGMQPKTKTGLMDGRRGVVHMLETTWRENMT